MLWQNCKVLQVRCKLTPIAPIIGILVFSTAFWRNFWPLEKSKYSCWGQSHFEWCILFNFYDYSSLYFREEVGHFCTTDLLLKIWHADLVIESVILNLRVKVFRLLICCTVFVMCVW